MTCYAEKNSRPECCPRPMPCRSQPEGSWDSYRGAPSGENAGAEASKPEFIGAFGRGSRKPQWSK